MTKHNLKRFLKYVWPFYSIMYERLIVEYANISGNLWSKITTDATPDSTGPIGHTYLFQAV